MAHPITTQAILTAAQMPFISWIQTPRAYRLVPTLVSGIARPRHRIFLQPTKDSVVGRAAPSTSWWAMPIPLRSWRLPVQPTDWPGQTPDRLIGGFPSSSGATCTLPLREKTRPRARAPTGLTEKSSYLERDPQPDWYPSLRFRLT